MTHVFPVTGREGYADNLPLVRFEQAVRVHIAQTPGRPCGACGALTDNGRSLGQDGLPPVLCGACTRKYLIDKKPYHGRIRA